MIKTNTYRVSGQLSNYIQSYRFIEIDNSQQNYPVQQLLPEARFEIFIHLQGPGNKISIEDQSWSVASGSAHGGFFDDPYQIHAKDLCRFLRIQFLPGGFTNFNFGRLDDFRNQLICMNPLIMPEMNDCFYGYPSEACQHLAVNWLNGYFESRLVQNDRWAYSEILVAIEAIGNSHGMIRIQDLAQQMQTSLSNLRKKFGRVVGISPKRFARIHRVMYIIKQVLAHKTSNLTQLAHEMQYFDQSHFIRDIKSFCGYVPGDLSRDEFKLYGKLITANSMS